MSTFKQGSKWKLLEAHGNPGDPGRLEAGAVATVREVVPAQEPGAHDSSEDAVVMEFEGAQAIAFGVGHAPELFQEVK